VSRFYGCREDILNAPHKIKKEGAGAREREGERGRELVCVSA